MSYVNLSESQFKSFMAGVRGAAAEAASKMKGEILQPVISEARSVAASTARKQIDQEFLALDTRLRALEETVRTAGATIHHLNNEVTRLKADQARQNPAYRVNLDVDGKISGVRVNDPTDKRNIREGDHMIRNGEDFWWWFGQWRRESELVGFSSWMARQVFKK